MGREIRRVPEDWEHPRYTAETSFGRGQAGKFIPLFDNDFAAAAEEWMVNLDLFRRGEHPCQAMIEKYADYFWQYDESPDSKTCRVRQWIPEEATHYQVYETVSEGTPLTPPLPSKQAVVDYLVTRGDFCDQQEHERGWNRAAAERFVQDEYAPS